MATIKQTTEQRTRGPKPENPEQRAARVKKAVRDLERIGAPFTVGDVAERAAVSRATIYRCADLRELVGAKGDGVRAVPADAHAKLAARHETAKAKLRETRRELADLELSWEAMRERALAAEKRAADAERKMGMRGAASSASNGHGALSAVAHRLGPDAMRQARRQLARALHPDLYARDSAAHALATELLKTLNALAE